MARLETCVADLKGDVQEPRAEFGFAITFLLTADETVHYPDLLLPSAISGDSIPKAPPGVDEGGSRRTFHYPPHTDEGPATVLRNAVVAGIRTTVAEAPYDLVASSPEAVAFAPAPSLAPCLRFPHLRSDGLRFGKAASELLNECQSPGDRIGRHGR